MLESNFEQVQYDDGNWSPEYEVLRRPAKEDPGAVSTRMQPTSETGIYLKTHRHEWQHVGAKRYLSGTLHPVFECTVCGDVICDLHVVVEDEE